MKDIKSFDPELFEAIEKEHQRQHEKLELIASENIVSPRVLEATGSVLTNKYAEGYPEKRYYGGCEYVDIAENLAIARAKNIFGAEHVNVQPHSGSQANMAVYMAELNPGDTVMGMDLSHGGHLTHGSPVNFSGLLYKIVSYGVRQDNQRLDYDQIMDLAKQHKPKMIIAGASAYPRAIDFKAFRDIADAVGATLMVDMAHIAGLVAAGLHQNPVPYADYVTTTTHKTLRGPRGGMILCTEEKAKTLNSRIFPGIQGGPLMHVIAAKAVALREAESDSYKVYQQQVIKNAQALAKALISHGYKLTTGGTDNHLMLMDLTQTEITGKVAQLSLDQANITTNKNTIPFETRSPFITSGIRLGTPALTTRGLKEKDMETVAGFIHEVLQNTDNYEKINSIGKKVKEFAVKFPEFQE